MDWTVADVVDKHRQGGIVKAGDLLLPPQAALSLIDDLERYRLLILGVDPWYEVNGDIAQGLDFLDMGDSRDLAHNAAWARQYITQHATDTAKYVSVVFGI